MQLSRGPTIRLAPQNGLAPSSVYLKEEERWLEMDGLYRARTNRTKHQTEPKSQVDLLSLLKFTEQIQSSRRANHAVYLMFVSLFDQAVEYGNRIPQFALLPAL